MCMCTSKVSICDLRRRCRTYTVYSVVAEVVRTGRVYSRMYAVEACVAAREGHVTRWRGRGLKYVKARSHRMRLAGMAHACGSPATGLQS